MGQTIRFTGKRSCGIVSVLGAQRGASRGLNQEAGILKDASDLAGRYDVDITTTLRANCNGSIPTAPPSGRAFIRPIEQ